MSTMLDLKPADPVHTKIRPDDFYKHIDDGIRFAVRVLHYAGYDTGQSCEGGQGHSYEYPSVDMSERAFGAAEQLQEYGFQVRQISSVWRVYDGVPTERIWRIELKQGNWARKDEIPQFITGHLHKNCWEW